MTLRRDCQVALTRARLAAAESAEEAAESANDALTREMRACEAELKRERALREAAIAGRAPSNKPAESASTGARPACIAPFRVHFKGLKTLIPKNLRARLPLPDGRSAANLDGPLALMCEDLCQYLCCCECATMLSFSNKAKHVET